METAWMESLFVTFPQCQSIRNIPMLDGSKIKIQKRQFLRSKEYVHLFLNQDFQNQLHLLIDTRFFVRTTSFLLQLMIQDSMTELNLWKKFLISGVNSLRLIDIFNFSTYENTIFWHWDNINFLKGSQRKHRTTKSSCRPQTEALRQIWFHAWVQQDSDNLLLSIQRRWSLYQQSWVIWGRHDQEVLWAFCMKRAGLIQHQRLWSSIHSEEGFASQNCNSKPPENVLKESVGYGVYHRLICWIQAHVIQFCKSWCCVSVSMNRVIKGLNWWFSGAKIPWRMKRFWDHRILQERCCSNNQGVWVFQGI